MILRVADNDEQGVNNFVRLAGDSDEVPKLRKRSNGVNLRGVHDIPC